MLNIYAVRDWILVCNVIGFESIRIRPSTPFQIIRGFKTFHSESGLKELRIRVDARRIRKGKVAGLKKHPDTCGRGLSQKDTTTLKQL